MESLGHTELKSYPESSRLFPITMEPKSINLKKDYLNNNAHNIK